MAKYDIAISFAGEQRKLAQSFATRLDASGYSVFYDEFEQAELWGRDLSLALGSVYEQDARFCLVIVSKEYVNKAWTNLERQNAISRFMRQHDNYILCLKTDGTSLPGLPGVIGYINLENTTQDEVFQLLLQKLGRPDHDDAITHLDDSDQSIAKQIIQACFRRAVFTRMASEIDMSAMNGSLGNTLGTIQPLTATIGDPALQYAALEIIAALDAIERIAKDTGAGVSNHLPPDAANNIDQHKMHIIRHLLEIRRAAKIPMQLPYNLRIDHFFQQQDADRAPTPISG